MPLSTRLAMRLDLLEICVRIRLILCILKTFISKYSLMRAMGVFSYSGFTALSKSNAS